MLFVLIILFILAAYSSFFEHKNDAKKIIFFILWCLCVSVAGFREAGCDKDSLAYLAVFNNNYTDIIVEKSFHIISSFVKLCFGHDFLFVLFIYAFIGISIKFIAIRQLTNLWFLACTIYIANFFILQDMTQIRTGVATGMLLLSIKPLYERRWKPFLLFSGIAIFFHYSAFLLLPLWILNTKNFNKYLYGSLIVLAYCFYFTGLTVTELLSYIPIEYIQEKLILNYKAITIQAGSTTINPFTINQTLRLIITVLLFWKLERITNYNKYIPLLLKIYVIGISSFLLFVDIPAFTLRISEFFQIVEIILIPSLIYTFKNKRIGIWLPISISIFFILMNLFHAKLIS